MRTRQPKKLPVKPISQSQRNAYEDRLLSDRLKWLFNYMAVNQTDDKSWMKTSLEIDEAVRRVFLVADYYDDLVKPVFERCLATLSQEERLEDQKMVGKPQDVQDQIEQTKVLRRAEMLEKLGEQDELYAMFLEAEQMVDIPMLSEDEITQIEGGAQFLSEAEIFDILKNYSTLSHDQVVETVRSNFTLSKDKIFNILKNNPELDESGIKQLWENYHSSFLAKLLQIMAKEPSERSEKEQSLIKEIKPVPLRKDPSKPSKPSQIETLLKKMSKKVLSQNVLKQIVGTSYHLLCILMQQSDHDENGMDNFPPLFQRYEEISGDKLAALGTSSIDAIVENIKQYAQMFVLFVRHMFPAKQKLPGKKFDFAIDDAEAAWQKEAQKHAESAAKYHAPENRSFVKNFCTGDLKSLDYQLTQADLDDFTTIMLGYKLLSPSISGQNPHIDLGYKFAEFREQNKGKNSYSFDILLNVRSSHWVNLLVEVKEKNLYVTYEDSSIEDNLSVIEDIIRQALAYQFSSDRQVDSQGHEIAAKNFFAYPDYPKENIKFIDNTSKTAQGDPWSCGYHAVLNALKTRLKSGHEHFLTCLDLLDIRKPTVKKANMRAFILEQLLLNTELTEQQKNDAEKLYGSAAIVPAVKKGMYKFNKELVGAICLDLKRKKDKESEFRVWDKKSRQYLLSTDAIKAKAEALAKAKPVAKAKPAQPVKKQSTVTPGRTRGKLSNPAKSSDPTIPTESGASAAPTPAPKEPAVLGSPQETQQSVTTVDVAVAKKPATLPTPELSEESDSDVSTSEVEIPPVPKNTPDNIPDLSEESDSEILRGILFDNRDEPDISTDIYSTDQSTNTEDQDQSTDTEEQDQSTDTEEQDQSVRLPTNTDLFTFDVAKKTITLKYNRLTTSIRDYVHVLETINESRQPFDKIIIVADDSSKDMVVAADSSKDMAYREFVDLISYMKTRNVQFENVQVPLAMEHFKDATCADKKDLAPEDKVLWLDESRLKQIYADCEKAGIKKLSIDLTNCVDTDLVDGLWNNAALAKHVKNSKYELDVAFVCDTPFPAHLKINTMPARLVALNRKIRPANRAASYNQLAGIPNIANRWDLETRFDGKDNRETVASIEARVQEEIRSLKTPETQRGSDDFYGLNNLDTWIHQPKTNLLFLEVFMKSYLSNSKNKALKDAIWKRTQDVHSKTKTDSPVTNLLLTIFGDVMPLRSLAQVWYGKGNEGFYNFLVDLYNLKKTRGDKWFNLFRKTFIDNSENLMDLQSKEAIEIIHRYTDSKDRKVPAQAVQRMQALMGAHVRSNEKNLTHQKWVSLPHFHHFVNKNPSFDPSKVQEEIPGHLIPKAHIIWNINVGKDLWIGNHALATYKDALAKISRDHWRTLPKVVLAKKVEAEQTEEAKRQAKAEQARYEQMWTNTVRAYAMNALFFHNEFCNGTDEESRKAQGYLDTFKQYCMAIHDAVKVGKPKDGNNDYIQALLQQIGEGWHQHFLELSATVDFKQGKSIHHLLALAKVCKEIFVAYPEALNKQAWNTNINQALGNQFLILLERIDIKDIKNRSKNIETILNFSLQWEKTLPEGFAAWKKEYFSTWWMSYSDNMQEWLKDYASLSNFTGHHKELAIALSADIKPNFTEMAYIEAAKSVLEQDATVLYQALFHNNGLDDRAKNMAREAMKSTLPMIEALRALISEDLKNAVVVENPVVIAEVKTKQNENPHEILKIIYQAQNKVFKKDIAIDDKVFGNFFQFLENVHFSLLMFSDKNTFSTVVQNAPQKTLKDLFLDNIKAVAIPEIKKLGLRETKVIEYLEANAIHIPTLVPMIFGDKIKQLDKNPGLKTLLKYCKHATKTMDIYSRIFPGFYGNEAIEMKVNEVMAVLVQDSIKLISQRKVEAGFRLPDTIHDSKGLLVPLKVNDAALFRNKSRLFKLITQNQSLVPMLRDIERNVQGVLAKGEVFSFDSVELEPVGTNNVDFAMIINIRRKNKNNPEAPDEVQSFRFVFDAVSLSIKKDLGLQTANEVIDDEFELKGRPAIPRPIALIKAMQKVEDITKLNPKPKNPFSKSAYEDFVIIDPNLDKYDEDLADFEFLEVSEVSKKAAKPSVSVTKVGMYASSVKAPRARMLLPAEIEKQAKQEQHESKYFVKERKWLDEYNSIGYRKSGVHLTHVRALLERLPRIPQPGEKDLEDSVYLSHIQGILIQIARARRGMVQEFIHGDIENLTKEGSFSQFLDALEEKAMKVATPIMRHDHLLNISTAYMGILSPNMKLTENPKIENGLFQCESRLNEKNGLIECENIMLAMSDFRLNIRSAAYNENKAMWLKDSQERLERYAMLFDNPTHSSTGYMKAYNATCQVLGSLMSQTNPAGKLSSGMPSTENYRTAGVALDVQKSAWKECNQTSVYKQVNNQQFYDKFIVEIEAESGMKCTGLELVNSNLNAFKERGFALQLTLTTKEEHPRSYNLYCHIHAHSKQICVRPADKHALSPTFDIAKERLEESVSKPAGNPTLSPK